MGSSGCCYRVFFLLLLLGQTRRAIAPVLSPDHRLGLVTGIDSGSPVGNSIHQLKSISRGVTEWAKKV